MMSSLYNKSKGSLNSSRSGTVSTYPKIDDAIRISSDDSSLENETIVQSSNGKIVSLEKNYAFNYIFIYL